MLFFHDNMWFSVVLTVTSILSRLLLDKATYYSRYEFQSKMWSEKYTFWHSTAGSPMGSTKVFPECIAWCYMYIIDFLSEKFDYSSNRRGVNTVKKPGNLSMAWIDVRKAYDSIDHKWLKEMMILHKFPQWLSSVVQRISARWNTWINARTRQGDEVSEIIKFNKDLPQGDALFPRLFTLCINPIAWKLKAAEGYRPNPSAKK